MPNNTDGLVLAIDQGTTGTTALLLNKQVEPIASYNVEFPNHYPAPGLVEHDVEEIWASVREAVEGALRESGRQASEIKAIGITNQRETSLFWHKDSGVPLHRALVWQDKRTAGTCENLKADGHEPLFRRKTGLVLDPYFSGTKAAWVLDNVDGARVLAESGRALFGTIDTWLLWNLTAGQSHLTDITNASRTLLFDSKKEKWSNEILKILNIPKSILPEVTPNVYNFGNTKLFGGKIIIGGMAGDQQAASIGQACIDKGQSKSTYGTGCFLLMNIGKNFKLSKNRLLTTVAYKIGDEKTYCYEGSIFVAGSAIQWLRDKLFLFKSSKETDSLYSKANKTENIIVVPALTGLGAPHWKSNVRGGIFGITRNTSIPEIVKATLDSLAFQTLDLVKSMQKDAEIKIKDIRVDGGMIANNNFVQSIANILQVKIIKPKNIETTALGAAYLAGINSGILKNLKEIKKLKESKKNYLPKINKEIIDKKVLQWRKTISFLIKYHS